MKPILKAIKSIGYALNGITASFKTEQNLRFHFVFSVVVLMMAYASGISRTEWVAVIFAVGLVISAELLNTAVENAVDLEAGGKTSTYARLAKDAAAGGVLVSAITAAAVGCVIFLNSERIKAAFAFLKGNPLYSCVLALMIIFGIIVVFFKKEK